MLTHALETAFSRFVLFLAAIAVGLLAAISVAYGAEIDRRSAVLLLGVIGIIVLSIVSGRPRCVLLFGWVVALTYGKAFFITEGGEARGDFQGIYWILSDAFLIVLFAMWLFARSRDPNGIQMARWRFWPWLIPFAAAALIATIGAIRTDWALFELLRIFNVILVVFFLGSNLHFEEWWSCVAGLAFATLAQGGLSVLQVGLRRTSGGLLGFIGAGPGAAAAQQATDMEQAMGGFFRAYGTIGHPANLATYFLLTIPLLVGLSFVLKGKLRWVAVGCAAAGLAGLACTQSRGPWVFAAVQVVVVMIAMLLFRVLSVKHVIVLSGIATIVMFAVVVRYEEFIVERFSRDYSESLELRSNDINTAYQIFAESPLTGVGPNNYAAKLLDYAPEWKPLFDEAKEFQAEMNSRVFVAPHNLFLFILAEMGILGLLSFVILIIGMLWIGLRGLIRTSGAERVVIFGIIVGIFATMAQSAINFSLWVDPVLFTFILQAGLLANAPIRQPNVDLENAFLRKTE